MKIHQERKKHTSANLMKNEWHGVADINLEYCEVIGHCG